MDLVTAADIETAYDHRTPTSDGPVILFDGVCNLCNGWVRFVIDRDPKSLFRFAPLQSDSARSLLRDFDSLAGVDSIILVENGRVLVKSNAVLAIARRLSAPWRFLSVFRVIPTFLRDFVYDLIARNRYSWFGRRDQCMIPTPEIRQRFLEQN